MPSATSSHHATSSPSLDHILHSLQQALHHHADPASALPQLSRAKLTLLHHNALIPSPSVPPKTLLTARSILETGALLSIRARDPESFVRYYNQLQPFYDFSATSSTNQHHYPASKDRSKITGLYLLLLLSQGDYAGFHTVLEGLVMVEGRDAEVEEDEFIRYPVELERSLMEGSYDQVWRKTKGEGVPGEEFALFSDVRLHPWFAFTRLETHLEQILT
jgi:26S proteasome regulatory subunit N12